MKRYVYNTVIGMIGLMFVTHTIEDFIGYACLLEAVLVTLEHRVS